MSGKTITKTITKIIALAIVSTMALAACEKKAEPTPAPTTEATTQATTEATTAATTEEVTEEETTEAGEEETTEASEDGGESAEVTGEMIPYPDGIGPFTAGDDKVVFFGPQGKTFEGPYLLTSVGQSSDIAMLEALFKTMGLEYTFNTIAGAADVAEANTILISAGMSTKGLGAAGISLEDEQARAAELLAACEEEGKTVIFTHLGGTARRGPLSDEFADPVMELAEYMIVVEEGNNDGYFSDYARENEVPISITNNIAGCLEPLKEILR